MTRLRPTLDDVTYADLVAQARARIPAIAPDWTDHNPSDPGITIVELLAWLTETLIYRADQLPDDRYRAFLTLLGAESATDGDLDDEIRRTLGALRAPWRAVTAADIEHLLLVEWPRQPVAQGLPAIRRVHCVPRRDLSTDATADQPGRLSVIIIPERDPGADPGALPEPNPDLRAAVHAWLEPRRLLGVQHHVVSPTYVPLRLSARIVLRPGYVTDAVVSTGVLTDAAIVDDVAQRAGALLLAHLDPLTGGTDHQGWPFGRNVYLSELVSVLDGLPGVDYVDGVQFIDLPTERMLVDSGEVVGARVGAFELVAATVVDSSGRVGRLAVALADAGRSG